MTSSPLNRLIDPHRPCRQAVTELEALMPQVSDKAAADTRARLADWLEQRARSYTADAKHLEQRQRNAGFATAMAAELRQVAHDVCAETEVS